MKIAMIYLFYPNLVFSFFVFFHFYDIFHVYQRKKSEKRKIDKPVDYFVKYFLWGPYCSICLTNHDLSCVTQVLFNKFGN